MGQIKLGIIGCGIAARTLHWPTLQKLHSEYAVTAVCSHTEEKAKEFAQMLGGIPYDLDYRGLLNRSDVEAVAILLPVHLNYQVVKDAVAAGKHILVEKPLAVSVAEAEELVSLIKDYPQVTMVAENFRYRRQFAEARLALKRNDIGEPYAVFWNCFKKIDKRANLYAQTQWRIHHRYPGGFVMDGGVHYIAALRDLLGEIKPLAAFKKTVNAEIGAMDSLSLQFAAAANVHGVFNLFFSSNGYLADQLIILGNNGTILVENDQLTVKRYNQILYTKQFTDDLGYLEEYQDFWRAVQGGATVRSTFAEGYADLKTVIQALECAESL
jgi:predicted dehydrogenase